MELSRATVIAMARADAQDRAEEKARREAEEIHQEEIVSRAWVYWHEYGEWEWQKRERAVLARAEARADEQRRAEAAERHQAHVAQLMAMGQQPRTVGEILAVAALYP
jgi:hypothetical protein